MAPRWLVCLAVLTISTTAAAERLPIRTYTVADGLAHNIVNRIVRDERGFLWFCTAEGLSLFDGYRFTNYDTTDGLPHQHVADVLATGEGVRWIATYGGLVRFNPHGTRERRRRGQTLHGNRAGDRRPASARHDPADSTA